MGHPINSIRYLLDEWEYLKQRYPFYAFILYQSQHQPFARFFTGHFNDLDEWSDGGTMFFAIAPPPVDWATRAEGRDYWKHYLATAGGEIIQNDDLVKEAAQQFDLTPDQLPAIVVFRDINDNDTIQVRLAGLKETELANYFFNLFGLFNRHSSRYMPLSAMREKVDSMPLTRRVRIQERPTGKQISEEGIRVEDANVLYDMAPLMTSPSSAELRTDEIGVSRRRKRVRSNHRAFHLEGPLSMQSLLRELEQKVESVQRQLEQLSREQREGFVGVNIKLDEVLSLIRDTSSRIDTFRQEFIQKYVGVNSEPGMTAVKALAARAELYSQFDEFLEQQALELREALEAKTENTIFPEVLEPFRSLLEQSSVQEVKTAELLWRYLADCGENAAVDYAVSALGLWKTLETELNRTFIDALRVYHNLTTPGVSSVSQQVHQRQKIKELGLFSEKQRAVDINQVRNGHFKGLEFGSIIGLLMNHQGNSISKILARIPAPPEESAIRSKHITQAAELVHIIADKYRNSYAHMHSMARSQCSEFRTILYDDHRVENPLFLTLHYKEVLLRSRAI